MRMHLLNCQIPLSRKLVGEQARKSLVSRLEETSAMNTMSTVKKGEIWMFPLSPMFLPSPVYRPLHPTPQWESLGYFSNPALLVWIAITNYYRLGVLNSKHFSQFGRLGSTKSGCQQIWCLVKALFLVYRWLSSSIFKWWRAKRESSCVSSYKEANLIHDSATLLT